MVGLSPILASTDCVRRSYVRALHLCGFVFCEVEDVSSFGWAAPIPISTLASRALRRMSTVIAV